MRFGGGDETTACSERCSTLLYVVKQRVLLAPAGAAWSNEIVGRFRSLLALGLFSAAAVALHCGSSGESVFGAACDELEGLCGGACATDSDCPNGVHCGVGGTCTAECSRSVPCATDLKCSPRGRCTSDGTDPIDFGFDRDGSVTDAGGSFDGQGEACASIDVTLSKIIPTVVLLVDQSSSMTELFGDAGTRWNVLRDAILEPDGGLVKPLENEVRFGLALYSFFGNNNSPQCPTLTQVSFNLGNYASIYNAYADASPIDNTPTGDSIDAVVGRLQDGGLVDGGFWSVDAGGPKFIVLATDGEPDTCEQLNPQNGQAEAVAAAQGAFGLGIKTFVIAIGPDVSLTHQQEMANAGAGQPVAAGDAGYFTTTNKQQLVAALRSIIFGVRPCKFTLNGSVQPGTESQGVVSLNGTPLVLNDPNGWKLNNPTEIELLGTSCDAIKNGSPQISVRFPCGTFIGVPR